MLSITYITGERGSGKTRLAHALQHQPSKRSVGTIVVDEGFEIDASLNPRKITAPALLSRVHNMKREFSDVHVVLVGDMCKGMLDALLVTNPGAPYFMIATMRVATDA